jgi:hypothetical protein
MIAKQSFWGASASHPGAPRGHKPSLRAGVMGCGGKPGATPLFVQRPTPCRPPATIPTTKIERKPLPLPAGEGRGEGESSNFVSHTFTSFLLHSLRRVNRKSYIVNQNIVRKKIYPNIAKYSDFDPPGVFVSQPLGRHPPHPKTPANPSFLSVSHLKPTP